MKPLFTHSQTAIAMSPADAQRATAPGPVLEIVSFRLADGIETQDFLAAAAGTEAILRDRGALVRRYLVLDDQGQWTDLIEWTSLEAALTAAEAVMQHPDFAPFGGMIDGETVDMRHAQIRFRMD